VQYRFHTGAGNTVYCDPRDAASADGRHCGQISAPVQARVKAAPLTPASLSQGCVVSSHAHRIGFARQAKPCPQSSQGRLVGFSLHHNGHQQRGSAVRRSKWKGAITEPCRCARGHRALQWNIQVAIAHGANSAFDHLTCSGCHHSTSHHTAAHHWAPHHPGATAASWNEEFAHVAHPHRTREILVMHSRFAGLCFGNGSCQQGRGRSG
jgi:hypothetical protein